jgi:hypothetical protein
LGFAVATAVKPGRRETQPFPVTVISRLNPTYPIGSNLELL